MKFTELGIMPEILKALEKQGYETPSLIQEKTIPGAILGKDILGLAQTGTGKTAAFAVPTLQRLAQEKVNLKQRKIRALILTPTRELASQIYDSFEVYGKNLNLKSTVIFGGVSQGQQVRALRNGIDILVATPGRLDDLIKQKYINLKDVEIFILDEADRMLDMGFIHDIRRVLKYLPKEKQTMLFSATMPPNITSIVNELLHNPIKASVTPVSSPVENIKQSLYYIDQKNKSKLLTDLAKARKKDSILVFTRTKRGADHVVKDLNKNGIQALAIHGNKSQNARERALESFKTHGCQVLVATDIAARGIDINELPLVINYDLSDVPETYIHRIGRTGRAGTSGETIAFTNFNEIPLLKDIEKLMGKEIEVIKDHKYPLIDKTPKKNKQKSNKQNRKPKKSKEDNSKQGKKNDYSNKKAKVKTDGQKRKPNRPKRNFNK
jgi:ATP-dependent RNA helicase RhlE